MSSAIANSFPNRNSKIEFLLATDHLNLYPESKPEFRYSKTFPEVIKEGYSKKRVIEDAFNFQTLIGQWFQRWIVLTTSVFAIPVVCVCP
jgi:hypothetical protein